MIANATSKLTLVVYASFVVLLQCLTSADIASTLAQIVTLNNGVRMPSYAFGMGTAKGREREVIEANFAAGVMHIDTAEAYGSDAAVGAVLSAWPREDIFVTSKVSRCDLPLAQDCRERTARRIAANLANLRVAYVDMQLLHSPPSVGCADGCAAVQAQWLALEDALAAGDVRAIGVSNFCESCFDCLLASARVPPAVNQLSFQAGVGPSGEDFNAWSRSRNGTLLWSYNGHKYAGLTLPSVVRLSAARGVPPATISMRYLWQLGVPFVSTSAKPEHIAENKAAMDLTVGFGLLTPSEMKQIREDPASEGMQWPFASGTCGAAWD